MSHESVTDLFTEHRPDITPSSSISIQPTIQPFPRRSIATWLTLASPLQLAALQWLCCLVIVFALMVPTLFQALMVIPGFSRSSGAVVRISMWQDAFSRFTPASTSPGTLLTSLLLTALLGSIVLAYALQAAAFWKVWIGNGTSPWRWWIGPIGSHLIMLLMAPMSADVFFYGMTGDLARNGINPYVHSLSEFPAHPFYRFNYWTDMTSVYGPVWTTLNRYLISVTGADPFFATLLFKVVLGTSALAVAGLVWVLAFQLTTSRKLATGAFILVSWQPNMIFETSGQAHNDSFMLLLLMLGMMVVMLGGTRALRGGLMLVSLSVGVKYVTLPFLGLLALLRIGDARDEPPYRWILKCWAIDLLVIAAVAVASFSPFWAGRNVLQEMVREPGRLFSNPLFQPRLRSLMREIGLGPLLRSLQMGVPIVLQLLVVACLLYTAWVFAHRIRHQPPDWSAVMDRSRLSSTTIGHLLHAWTILAIAIAMGSPNAHSWYFTWPILPVALLLAWRRHIGHPEYTASSLPNWFWGYLILTAIMTFGSFQVV